MARSWFDEVAPEADADEQAPDGLLADDEVADDDMPTAVIRSIRDDEGEDVRPAKPVLHRKVASPAPSVRRTPQRPTPRLASFAADRTTMTAIVAAAAVSLGVIGAAAWMLGDDDPEVPATVPLASQQSQQPHATPQKPSVGIAGDCAPTGGQVSIDADTSSLRGAIVAFESAYYSQNAAGIGAVVADGSGLAQTDWATVLPDAAPSGVTWCAVMQPATGSTVAVDLTVTSPDGDVTTYPQTITGMQQAGSWQLVSVASR